MSTHGMTREQPPHYGAPFDYAIGTFSLARRSSSGTAALTSGSPANTELVAAALTRSDSSEIA